MATRTIGYRETPDAGHSCSACGGSYVPNSTVSPFHFSHVGECPLYRALNATWLSDKERFNYLGAGHRPYRDHELTLIADCGKEVTPSTDKVKSQVIIYGIRGYIGTYTPNWQYVGLRVKPVTLTID